MRLSAAPRWSGGHHPVGDATSGPVRLSFNPQLRIEFRGATVTSDAGLLLPRELDKRLGLDALIEQHLTDPRSGHNRQFPLPDLFRRASDPACAVLRAPACRESLDRDPLSADPLAHRAARLASDVMMLPRAATGRGIIAGSGVSEERRYQRQRLRDMEEQRRWRGERGRRDGV